MLKNDLSIKIIKTKYINLNQFESEKNNIKTNKIKDPIFYILFRIFKYNKNITKIINKCHNFLQKNTFYFLFNTLFFYLNILGFYSYRKTLEGCVGTQEECLKMDIINFFKNLVIYMIYSILIVSTTITLSIWRYISISQIIYIIYKYYLFYKEDHYSNLEKHGQYNMIIFISGVIIISFFLNIIFIINKLNAKGFNISIYLLISILIICCTKIINIIKNKSNCYQWEWGLNNTNINKYNNSECTIIIPKDCPMYAYYGIMDFSRFVKLNCKSIDYKNSKDLLLYHLYKNNNYNFTNTIKFGYPNTNIFSFYNISNIGDFNKQVLSKIIDFDNKTILNNLNESERPEIVLEFNNDYNKGKININVTYKKNLAIERKKKESPDSIYDNILFIFFDTLSRVHFQRAMKKTSKFIEKYMKPKNNFLYSAYQFNKYHSVGINTLPNIAAMFYGMPYTSGRGQNIIKYFKESGYITAQIGNICSKELFEINGIKNNLINYENFDHENIGMWCDPNYFDINNPYPVNKGEFSVLRRCLYGKESYEYVLEYTKQFWEKYKNNKKFARVSFIEGHEITGEVIKYLDQPVEQFLEEFMKKEYLKNTAIILASDHGLHYGLYIDTKREDALIEHYLPLLIFLIPKNNNKINNEELHNNQDIFITPYDIYNSLIHIIKGSLNCTEYSKNGNTLFEYINPKGRNCNKFSEEIGPNCKCILSKIS